MRSAPLPLRPRAPITVRVAVAGLLAAMAITSCGRESSTTSTETAGTIGEPVVVIAARPDSTTAPLFPTAPPPQEPIRTVSRDDLLDEERATATEVWADQDDPRVLHVRFANGIAPCAGARVAVDEGPATVRVLLFTGRSPDGVGRPCATGLIEHEIVVTLARPLGTREVVW